MKILLISATVPHSLSPYPSEEEEQYFYSFPQLGCPTPPRNLHMEHKGENSIVISWGSSKILDSSFKEVNKPLLGELSADFWGHYSDEMNPVLVHISLCVMEINL